MSRALYSLLFSLLLPAVLLRMAWRSRRIPAYRRHWSERLGKVASAMPRQAVIVHGCSVGETQAASVLINWLTEQQPAVPVILTHTTPTGRARGEALLPDVACCYLPFDLPWLVSAWLDQLQPRALVLMETELWPNLIAACQRRNIPVSLANARLSERSFRGYQKVRRLMTPVWQALHWVGCQYRADADRLLQLGTPASRTEVVGNLKLAMPVAEAIKLKAAELRQQWCEGRSCWIAGSTHPGEEEQVLDLHIKLLQRQPSLLLLLAPRHPERAREIIELCQQRQLQVVRRSLGEQPGQSTQVVLIDTLGELMLFYGVADVAFVGGSLVAHGGHNPFEPLQMGRVALVGPHMFNFQSLLEELQPTGRVRQVADVQALEEAVSQALLEPVQDGLEGAGVMAAPGHWIAAILAQT